MFIKHELVVKDHETMHNCWGGLEDGGREGEGDFMADFYVADLLQGFWGSNVLWFFFKGVER